MLEENGWRLSADECMRLFIGKAVKDEAAPFAVVPTAVTNGSG